MVLFNHSTRELTAKIVYYGPGLCGKTTNLRLLHERLEKGTAGRLLSLATAQDRTIYFDLLPVELGNIKGYTVRFQLCTVPGQVFYNETRKLVLRGVDGVVFVVDSQWSMLSHNLESFQNLVENLRDLSVGIESVPVVIQYNKRDLPGVLSVDALQESLGFPSYPFVEAVASTGQGVVETFKLISKLTFVDLLRRLQRSGGLESDVFSLPKGTPPEADETVARAGPPAKRTSFVEEKIAEKPAAPAADSPFDAGPGWMPPAESDVFGLPAGDAAPVAAAELPDPEPLEMTPEPVIPATEIPAPAPEPLAIASEAEAPELVVPEPAPAPEPPPPPPPAAPDPAHAEALARHDGELAGLREEVGSLRAAVDDVRRDLASVRSELGAGIETLSSTLHERVAALGSDLFAAREESERARAELREAQRAAAEKLDTLASGEAEARFADALRVAEEARAGLAQRLEAAEGELARSRAVTEEAHRLIDERLGAAERRTRSLAESIRRALEGLE